MSLLPDEFADLEPFIEWSLPTERARNAKRLASSMEEITKFYQAMLPRTEKILEYLDRFELGKMPEREQRLMDLTLGFAEVANAVELFKNPAVIDGFDPKRLILMHER
ncbi:MAG TPA: hypothetical protein VNE82_17440 [Candidatus Binataceae bacterium]|nr:hypothetical protein [Candidatus Binataceae bacterium]HVB81718.1 hypothetical protein [Candidatus Binataceae bacterium]